MDIELEELHPVTMTHKVDWSPSQYDPLPSSSDSWFKKQDGPDPLYRDFNFAGEHLDADVGKSLGLSILSVLCRQDPVPQDLDKGDLYNK